MTETAIGAMSSSPSPMPSAIGTILMIVVSVVIRIGLIRVLPASAIPKYHTVTLESDFGAAVRMQILIKDKYIEAFQKELTELTSATVVPHELEHRFDEIPE